MWETTKTALNWAKSQSLITIKIGYSPDPKTNLKFRFSFLQIFHKFKQQQIKVTW